MATHFNILAWKIPMDRGAWQTTVHGVAKSQTRLSTHAQAQMHKGKSNQSKVSTEEGKGPALQLGDHEMQDLGGLP